MVIFPLIKYRRKIKHVNFMLDKLAFFMATINLNDVDNLITLLRKFQKASYLDIYVDHADLGQVGRRHFSVSSIILEFSYEIDMNMI